MPSPGAPFSLNRSVFANPETLPTPKLSFGVFMETSLHRHDCLNHWTLATDSTASSSPLLGGHGVGPKWHHWHPAPILGAFQKSPH